MQVVGAAISEVVENREASCRLNINAFVAACVCEDFGAAERVVCVRVDVVEMRGGCEAVYKRGKASLAVCVGQEVEGLKSLCGRVLVLDNRRRKDGRSYIYLLLGR